MGLVADADRLIVMGAVAASGTVIVAPAVTTSSTPLWLPAALGATVTDTVQLAPGASDCGHAFVRENSAAPGAIEMLSRGSGTVPELVSVSVCGWLVVPTA